jgi:Domain of unknown function (DUF4177)
MVRQVIIPDVATHSRVLAVVLGRSDVLVGDCAQVTRVPAGAATSAGEEVGTMPYVTCPTCGERGKIPPNLVGARIKCRKCGLGFQVAAPAAKTAAGANAPVASPGGGSVPSAVAEPLQGIEVEGLDASSWVVPSETVAVLKAEAVAPATATADPVSPVEPGPVFVAAEPGGPRPREFKLLTPKDKIFDNKFDIARLEEALNHYGRQGWSVKAMSTPHLKNFTGALEEVIVVVLER